MSYITIAPGQLVTKDPADAKLYRFDWTTKNLQVGAAVTASTFTITGPDVLLTKDSENIPTQGCVRLTGGTLGAMYEVANKIVTNETPSQTKERSFLILIENS
jgi:hypothetical protein